ncbi:MAG: hypothetical protein CW341_11755 [Bacteroidetes bacterium]|nr:hypothetical protein [Bacteroidota bacterium]
MRRQDSVEEVDEIVLVRFSAEEPLESEVGHEVDVLIFSFHSSIVLDILCKYKQFANIQIKIKKKD